MLRAGGITFPRKEHINCFFKGKCSALKHIHTSNTIQNELIVLCIHIHTYMYIKLLIGNAFILKENREQRGYIRALGGRKRKGEKI